MDSLRYCVLECHVDGFRFDLASALAREFYDVDRLSAFFDMIHQDPVLSQVKLIAEPWDVGPGGYQVGNFPVLWAEWNGKYRDAMRDFWRGQAQRRRVRAALHRLERPLPATTAATRSPRSTSSPPTTASRCATSSRTTRSTTRRTARTTATAPTTTAPGTAAPRARPTTRRCSRCARASSATSSRRCSSRRACRCCSAATSSGARSAATTTPGARTTRSRGSTGSRSRRSELLAFTRRLIALRREHPVFRRTLFLTGTAGETRAARRLVVPARRAADDAARLASRGHADARRLPQRPRDSASGRRTASRSSTTRSCCSSTRTRSRSCSRSLPGASARAGEWRRRRAMRRRRHSEPARSSRYRSTR